MNLKKYLTNLILNPYWQLNGAQHSCECLFTNGSEIRFAFLWAIFFFAPLDVRFTFPIFRFVFRMWLCTCAPGGCMPLFQNDWTEPLKDRKSLPRSDTKEACERVHWFWTVARAWKEWWLEFELRRAKMPHKLVGLMKCLLLSQYGNRLRFWIFDLGNFFKSESTWPYCYKLLYFFLFTFLTALD